MINNTYFYHEHIKRAVAVFGTLFNNISIQKTDHSGKVLSRQVVPLSYGPRAKFLSRIEGEGNLTDPKLAIKLPRMSFEISALAVNKAMMLPKNTIRRIGEDGSFVNFPVPYKINFALSIYSKNQDDVLQILEQILPFFRPDFTVTVKEIDGSFRRDMPFVLGTIGLSDDYETDYATKRAIVYTLDFETTINFYGPIQTSKQIHKVQADIANVDMPSTGIPLSTIVIEAIPQSGNNEVVISTTYPGFSSADSVVIDVVSASDFEVGDNVTGLTSATVGKISAIDQNHIMIISPDGEFIVGENLSNGTDVSEITNVENTWLNVPSE
jgi:hypothetical protein